MKSSIELLPLLEVLKSAVYSSYLEKDKSFSVIIIADPELNKTKTLMKFAKMPKVSVQSDLTYYGIVEELLPKIKQGDMRTIIIPDMLKAILKKQSTSNNFITILNSMIEEGVFDVTLRNTKNFGGARCNIMTSVTPNIYFDNRKFWNKIGFFSRIIPFSYSYTDDRIADVFKSIGKYNVQNGSVDSQLPIYSTQIALPEKFADVAEDIAKIIGEKEKVIFKTRLGSEVTLKGSKGFRHKWQLQSMLKSFALMRGSFKVEKTDVDKLKFVSRWLNYDFNPL